MKTKIVEPEEFGLGFIYLTHQYKAAYEEKLLGLLERTCDEYLKYFSSRTLISSLRVLSPNSLENNVPVPEAQRERYDVLFCHLFRQYITLNKYTDRAEKFFDTSLLSTGIDLGMVETRFGVVTRKSQLEFQDWVIENELDIPAEYILTEADKPIPVRKEFLADFNGICIQMVRYSLGQRTYMPCVTAEFLLKNLDLIQRKTWEEIHQIINSCGIDQILASDVNWKRLSLYLDQLL